MNAKTAAVDARKLFERVTGAEPTGLWSAPGRVNLIGEHTDYNDGFVFPLAIDRRSFVALGPRGDGKIRVSSTFAPEPVVVALSELDGLFPRRRDEIAEWARYPLGVAWALARAVGADLPGVDLAFASDVPIGAGLSSSAAIECAAAVALNEAWGLGLDPVALARAGRLAENEAVGAPTGIMDQMASMIGEADAGIFLDCRSLDAQAVPLGFAAFGLELLVIDTRVKHAHTSGGYGERRAACERGAALVGVAAVRDIASADLERARVLMDDRTFRRVRHVVTENQRVLDTVRTLREEGARGIGNLLDASHASMRDDFEISVPELDLAVEAARAAGALGARLTGGGFGGAAIALVDRELAPAVSKAVTVTFVDAGLLEPRIFTVQPSLGARREPG